MNKVIASIIKLEWEALQEVNNEGGRATCQDDLKTFTIMRTAQFLAWDIQVLNSYYEDLISAKMENRNLVAEKYVRMMKYTSPQQYLELEKYVPKISNEKIELTNKIIDIQLKWQTEYVIKYPILANHSRPVSFEKDNSQDTSFETYLRGELLTYSDKTLKIYFEYIQKLYNMNVNMSLKSIENTAKLYGFASIEDMQSSLK